MSPAFRACRRLIRVLPALLLLALAGCVKPAASGDYLFCFWNVENFFDNRANGWHNKPDKEYDRWFAEDKAAFEQKVKNLTEVLAALNDGRGPDILALAEVESDSTAADALVESLNRAIKPDVSPYKYLLKKDLHGGRNIMTVIITRLPVVADRTQLLDKRHRILEGHIDVGGRDLTVLASHWTSRLTDEKGEGRAKYADRIYGRVRAITKANPDAAVLVCGDFNDNPDDVSVTEHLHATGELARVQGGGDPPMLYDVFAELWAKNKGGHDVGTHFYRGKGSIFDHIVVSPGMVNGKGGWQCRTETATIVRHADRFVVTRGRNKGHPASFGSPEQEVPLSERGASDHLPVTVRLRVN